MSAQFPALAGLPMSEAAAAATLPVTVRGETIGAMVVWDTQPRHWTQGQQDLLVGLAAQGGQAVARAKAYEDQVTAANTLQESLLPSRLPDAGTSRSRRGTSPVRAGCGSAATGTTASRSATSRSPSWSATSWARVCTRPR